MANSKRSKKGKGSYLIYAQENRAQKNKELRIKRQEKKEEKQRDKKVRRLNKIKNAELQKD
jgi:hypothetical protein